MKVALAILVGKQPEPFLDDMLKICEPHFDGTLIRREEKDWTVDYASARNDLIKQAETQGFDAIFFLDADECMFPEDIRNAKAYLQDFALVLFPEIEFASDFEHFESYLFPDKHYRAFRLNQGFHYENSLHEGLVTQGATEVTAVNCPIYHYGKCKPKELLLIKYNHYREMQGLSPIETDVFWNELSPFHGKHPFKRYEKH